MTTKALPTTRTLVAAAAGLALALTGAACSGDGEAGGASADAKEAPAAARGGDQAGPGAEVADRDASPARFATAEFDVDGMTCGGCALATEMSVKKLEGVKSADAEYDEEADEGRCTVEYDPSAVDTGQIAAAIEEAGFTPTLDEEEAP